jgi:hypothetical protein
LACTTSVPSGDGSFVFGGGDGLEPASPGIAVVVDEDDAFVSWLLFAKTVQVALAPVALVAMVHQVAALKEHHSAASNFSKFANGL